MKNLSSDLTTHIVYFHQDFLDFSTLSGITFCMETVLQFTSPCGGGERSEEDLPWVVPGSQDKFPIKWSRGQPYNGGHRFLRQAANSSSSSEYFISNIFTKTYARINFPSWLSLTRVYPFCVCVSCTDFFTWLNFISLKSVDFDPKIFNNLLNGS